MISEQKSYFAIILIITALLAGGGTLYSAWTFQSLPAEKKFEELWRRDLSELISEKKLPEGFYSLAEIKYFGGDKRAKDWLNKIHAPFDSMEGGKYNLEVILLTWDEERRLGVVVQYDLIEKKSGNTIWEGGRTFVLEDVAKN